MDKINNNIRIALISTMTPDSTSQGDIAYMLYKILANREADVIVDIFTWNIKRIPHKQSVIAAEQLKCGLTELRVPFWKKSLGIKALKLPIGVEKLIRQSYSTVWIVGNELSNLLNEFPNQLVINDYNLHANI